MGQGCRGKKQKRRNRGGRGKHSERRGWHREGDREVRGVVEGGEIGEGGEGCEGGRRKGNIRWFFGT